MEVLSTDGDGLSDDEEVALGTAPPLQPDTDGDGVDDGTEIGQNGDPLEKYMLTIEPVAGRHLCHRREQPPGRWQGDGLVFVSARAGSVTWRIGRRGRFLV